MADIEKIIEYKITGNPDEFNKVIKDIENKANKNPINVRFELDTGEIRGQLGKLQSQINSVFRKNSLGKNVLAVQGIPQLKGELEGINTVLKDIQKNLSIRKSFDILPDLEQKNKELQDMKNLLSGMVNFKTPTKYVKMSANDYFDNDTAKANIEKLLSDLRMTSGNISTTINAEANKYVDILKQLARFQVQNGNLDKIINLPEGEIISLQNLLNTITNGFMRGAHEGENLSDVLKRISLERLDTEVIDVLSNIQKLESETKNLQAELKIAEGRESGAINISLDQKSIDGLKEEILRLREGLNLGDEATIGFKTEDIDRITGAFERLENTLEEIRKTITEIDFSKIGTGQSSTNTPANQIVNTQQEIREEVEKTTEAIREQQSIANQNGLSSDKTPVSSNVDDIEMATENFKELEQIVEREEQTVKESVNDEAGVLSELSNALKEVTQLVNNKTDAFTNEKGTVSEVVNSEIKDLERLSGTLKEISDKAKIEVKIDKKEDISGSNKEQNSNASKNNDTALQNKLDTKVAERTKYQGNLAAAEIKNNQAVIESSEKRIAVTEKEIEKLKEKGKVDEQIAKESEKNQKALISAEEKVAKASESQAKREATNLNRQSKMVKDFSLWLSKNGAAAKAYGNEISLIFEQLRNQGELTAEQLNEVQREINNLMATAAHEGKTGSTFMQTLEQRFKSLGAYLASFASFYDVVRYIREGINVVKEYDTALTEMRKVSDESLSTLKEYASTTFEVGDSVGAIALTIQNSTADWQRLGEAIEDASESAKVSNILLNVSEFENINDATESLVSASQAYKDLDKIEIVDKLNNIGNNFSISTDQLAQGLQNTAAVLQTQGNDIDEAVALLTAANSQVQDISKASMGVRTISLRIASTEEAKGELADLGEDVDDFIVQTQSKTQQLIKDYTAVASNAYQGVDVLDANGNLRDTYEILLDISRIYKEIQEEDKKAGTNRANALVEFIAGKNRSNIAASILNAPDLLERVYQASQHSEGSAQAELDKYLDSIEGKLTQTTNKMQEFANIVVNSDSLKTMLDILNGILGVINDIAATPLAPILLGSGAGVGAFIKNLDQPTYLVA